MTAKNDKIVELAQKAVEEYVKNGRTLSPPEDVPPELLNKKRGVFVSIKKNGNLRGCIGTVKPTQNNVAQEIIKNAIKASSQDPRFSEIRSDELDDLKISVDILGEYEPVSDLEELNPETYGVIVKKGHQSGLLLPDLEGIDTVEEQVNIARKKAGLSPQENIDNLDLYRFKVKRYE